MRQAFARGGGESSVWLQHLDSLGGGAMAKAQAILAERGVAWDLRGAGQGPSSGAALEPAYFLNADDRGGTGPNGLPSLTVEQAAAQITVLGYSWNGTGIIGTSAVVTYSFRDTAPATMPNGTSGFSQFNAQQIAQAERSLQSWSDVANITFVRVGGTGYSNDGQIVFGNYDTGASGSAAFAYYPGDYWPESGDVWVNSTLSYNANPQLLNYGRMTLSHEIGHAIGLNHPHENYGSTAGYYEDSRQYSVMSYWSETNTAADFQGNYAAAPLLDDIAAAQRLYGANWTTRAGNTVYGFGSNSGRDYYLASSASTELIFAVWDGGGIDTLNFSGYSDDQVIDLRQGYFSNVGGLVGNVVIAIGAVIENATGGSGADVLIGNSVANTLNGGAGADSMQGRAGNDTYRVDNAGDLVVEAANEGTDRVVSSISYTLADNVENLTLAGNTGISGTGNALNNSMVGNGAANSLSGGGGNDLLNGGLGADTMLGGTGNDTYYVDNAGDLVTEAAGEGNDLVRSNVSFTLGANVERLILTGAGAISGTGNALTNGITGNAAANTLRGEGGNDVISGGGGGDSIYGGAGSDRLTGGVGADNFYFDTALHATANVDRIIDFSSVNDSIYLDMSVFSEISAAGALSASAFRLGTAATDADDRIIYDQATGKLYYDADGNGPGAAVLFAQLAAGATLTSADLIAY